MEEENVPHGWTRSLLKGRIVYSSPASLYQPQVKIHSRAELSQYHRKGKFLDVDEDKLVFASKRKPKEKKYEVRNKIPSTAVHTPSPENGTHLKQTKTSSNSAVSEATEVEDCEIEEVFNSVENHLDVVAATGPVNDEISTKQRKKLENEQNKLAEMVSKLTIDPSKQVKHRVVLENAAKRLSDARSNQSEDFFNLESFKSLVKDCNTVEEMIKLIWKDSFFQQRFSHLFTSKLHEQLLSLGSISGNPLKSFPVDINNNVYCDIMNFALENAKDVMLLLTTLTKKHENPIAAKDVINLAYSFSSLAEAACSHNNSLKKVKSLCLRSSGLTNSGLDSLASIGVTETSRSCRNDRDVMASLSEEILKKYAKKYVVVFTFDNMDIRINSQSHHLTLNLLEFEQIDTSTLPTEAKEKEELLEFFTKETLILQSDGNKELFEHFQFVTAVTVGRLIGEEVEGMGWLLSVLPNHYKHANSDTACNKALLHVDKPMYLQETKNCDMFKIMKSLQLRYLNFVGEQAEDKERFAHDMKLILSVESPADVREAAEARIKIDEKKAGVLICHGDHLTKERFEACKRLAQSCASAFERFEYMPVFRIGMFHLRMNKSIMDLEAGMQSLVNVEDDLSLGYFRTILGLNQISNQADTIKRCGEFERHDQFLLSVGKEILINAFKTFISGYTEPITKTEDGAKALILTFLSVSDIKYFWDPENFNEKVKFDDILSSCRDNAGRTVLSMVADKVEHEGDGMGIRAVRRAMIPYFLNKKIVQSSKYAISLLSDCVNYLGQSERTRTRIDLLATCNPTGGAGKGLARDTVNEHKVRLVKNSIRGLHSQLSDSVLSKTVLGSNVLHQLYDHDNEAMLLPLSGGGSSYEYIGKDLKLKVRAEVEKVCPFDLSRKKRDYFEKTSGSVFSGLTVERVDRFLTRNKVNFKRSYPHKKN